jgi:chemotaxis protein methyltransferase CheR
MAASYEVWAPLAQWLEREIGFQLEPSRWYLFESAFRPLLKELQLSEVRDLIAAASRNPALRQRCINCATINESLFFRDQNLWPDLATRILPQLKQDCAFRGHISVLICACSRGQEVWSLIMTARENDIRLNILATDVDTEVLSIAQSGIYSDLDVSRGLSDDRRSRFMERHGANWQVRPDLRRDLIFQTFNLATDFTFPQRFDLVLCRNVLIYFTLPMRQRIVERLATYTANWGFLLLGGAESLLGVTSPWQARRIGQTTVYQKQYGRPQ